MRSKFLAIRLFRSELDSADKLAAFGGSVRVELYSL